MNCRIGVHSICLSTQESCLKVFPLFGNILRHNFMHFTACRVQAYREKVLLNFCILGVDFIHKVYCTFRFAKISFSQANVTV